MNKLAKNLQKIRKEHHLSQEQLAERLNVSRQAISKWESGAAYPEMEKIVQICEEFDVDINVLLKADIDEALNEQSARAKANKYVDGFLEYITEIVKFSGAISRKTRLKCIFEQIGLAIVFYALGAAVGLALLTVIGGIFGAILPAEVNRVILRIVWAVYLAFAITVAVICMLRIFRLRYLDYYEKGSEKPDEDSAEEACEGTGADDAHGDAEGARGKEVHGSAVAAAATPSPAKVIIRSPNHELYAFVRCLGKFLLFCVKVLAALLAILLGISIIMTLIVAAMSFGFMGSGVFFVGVLVAGLAGGAGLVALFLTLINFILGRKTPKKVLALVLAGSVVGIGLGCGGIALGATSFEYGEVTSRTETTELEMKQNLVLLPNIDNVQFIVTDASEAAASIASDDQITIEYRLADACDAEMVRSEGPQYELVYIFRHCFDTFKNIRFGIDQLNHKKFPVFNPQIQEVKIYANRETVAKLKENRKDYQKTRE